jgi:ribose transport system permease protein
VSATAPERAAEAPVPGKRSSGVARAAELQRTYPIAQMAALIAIYLYGIASIPGFASRSSLYAMLVLASLLGLVAAGQTLVLLIGGIDFSVPAYIVAGATLTVQLTGKGWSFLPILALVIAIPAVLGGIAGWIAHRFRIFPLVVTLAMGSIVTGGTLVWSQGLVLSSAPAWLTRFTSPIGKTFGVSFPPIAVLWLVVAVIIGIVLHRTVAGRWIYATGSNPRAADLALVRTRRVWVATFAFSAIMASVVGVLIAGFSGSGEQSIGDPYLFQSLTAVVIGGTAFGARGDYWRTVLGTLILTVLTTVLVGKGANAADQEILSGGLILVVVAVYGREKRLRDRV